MNHAAAGVKCLTKKSAFFSCKPEIYFLLYNGETTTKLNEDDMDYKREEIAEHFDDWLNETMKHEGYEWIKDNLDDLHHHAFNTDYYIIGTELAINWMGSYSWDIMQFVKSYEIDNFGEVLTDITNPERLVNMYAYIIGEEIVSEYVMEQEAA